MNVLITGASGFVGQHLVKALVGAGHTVVGGCVDDQLPPVGVLTESDLESVRWELLDVTDDAQIEAAIASASPDWVFHLAGQSSVGSSFHDVLGTWEVNATGTLRLLVGLQRADGQGARVVVVSSGEVYGAVPEAEQPIAEDRPPAPLSPYAAAKLAAEVVAVQMSRMGNVDAVVARSFNHTGPGQSTRFALASWAEQLARIAAGDAEPRLRVGNLRARRDWLDVRDVVRAYMVLAERGSRGEIYNVCSGMAYSLHDLARMMIEATGRPIELEVETSRLRSSDIPLLQGDPAKLEALGWKARVPLSQTLGDLLGAAEIAR